MPNGTFAPGSPVANAMRGFDNPFALHCVVDSSNKVVFFGKHAQCEFYVEISAYHLQIKPLNPKTGKP